MSLPPRPGTVTLANYLLGGVAAVWLSGAGAAYFALPHVEHAVSAEAEDPLAGSFAAVLVALVTTGAVLLAVLPVLLTVFGLRGSPTGRVLSIVLCSVAIPVALLLLLIDPFGSVRWLGGVYAGVSVLTVLLAVAVIVLLARRTVKTWSDDAAATRRARRPSAVPPGNPYAHPPVG